MPEKRVEKRVELTRFDIQLIVFIHQHGGRATLHRYVTDTAFPDLARLKSEGLLDEHPNNCGQSVVALTERGHHVLTSLKEDQVNLFVQAKRDADTRIVAVIEEDLCNYYARWMEKR